MKKIFLPLLITSILALVIFCGCGKDKVTNPITAPELIAQGWDKFGAGNFSGASGDFSAALALDSTANGYDGLLGLGWAELRRSKAGLASKAFVAYLDTIPDSVDGKAGLSLASLAKQNFLVAIDNALSVLSSAPSWSFNHDSNFNHLDLKLVLVQSYYLSANYAQSLAAINQYFDPAFNPGDVNTFQGRTALAAKIQSLKEEVS